MGNIPVSNAAEDGTLTYGGVVVGEPRSGDTLVQLAVVKVEELTGGTVLDQPGEGEMLLQLGDWVYEVNVTALHPPQGPVRKYVLIGRRVQQGTPESEPEPEPEPEPKAG